MLKYIRLFGNGLTSYIDEHNDLDRPNVSLVGSMDYVSNFSVKLSPSGGSTYYIETFGLIGVFRPDELLIRDINGSSTIESFDVIWLWSLDHSNFNVDNNEINEEYSDHDVYAISFTSPDVSDISNWEWYMSSSDYRYEAIHCYDSKDLFWEGSTIQVTGYTAGNMDMVRYNKEKKYITFDCSTYDQETGRFTVLETNMTTDDIYDGNMIYVNAVHDGTTLNVVGFIGYDHYGNQYKVELSNYDINGNLIDSKPNLYNGFTIDSSLNVYYYHDFLR